MISESGLPALLRPIIDEEIAQSMDVEVCLDPSSIDEGILSFAFNRSIAIVLNELDRDVLNRLQAAGMRSLAVHLFVRDKDREPLVARWRWLRQQGVEPRLQLLRPGRDAELSPLQYDELIKTLYAIDRDEFGITWPVSPPHAGRSNMRHLYSCHIAACGTVYASADLPIPLGTVRTESLREILNLSEVLENLRDYRTKVKEPCRTCSRSVACYGSREAAYALTGDYLAGDPFCERADGVAIPSLPVAIAGLIPHGPTMRVVDQLVAIDERETTTAYTVKHGSPFVDAAGRLDETAYIEMIAQSFAASHGFHLPADEQPLHRGLLIGIKDLNVAGQAVVGDRLRIHMRKVTRFGDFGVVDGTIHHDDGRFLASGQIKVWRPSDEAAKAMIP